MLCGVSGFSRSMCVCGIWVDPVPGGLNRVGVVAVVCLFCVGREGCPFGGVISDTDDGG